MRKPNLKKAAKVVLKVADAVADAEVLPVVPQAILETAVTIGKRAGSPRDQTCLNCRFVHPTDSKTLKCTWPGALPKAASLTICYIAAPYADCPTWEAQ